MTFSPAFDAWKFLPAIANCRGVKLKDTFPELRCSFGSRSIVPDIAVFKWSRIPFDPDGEVPKDFCLHPDWTIEILSPEQSSNRVIGNILDCLQHGWLIDPADCFSICFSIAIGSTTRIVTR